MLIRENDCKGKPSKSCKEMMIMKGKANSEKSRKTKELVNQRAYDEGEQEWKEH